MLEDDIVSMEMVSRLRKEFSSSEQMMRISGDTWKVLKLMLSSLYLYTF